MQSFHYEWAHSRMGWPMQERVAIYLQKASKNFKKELA